MSTQINVIKHRLSFQWIKASDSGRTYVGPAGYFGTRESLTDEELRRWGVDESLNPHND